MAPRRREFVTTVVGLGETDLSILGRYVLPNVMVPVIAAGSFLVVTAILLQSALSFLGRDNPNLMR